MIDPAGSFQADAKLSGESKRPIVVFVTQKGCHFCQQLREQVLFPMIKADDLTDRIILREVSLDEGTEFFDFDGSRVTGRNFAGHYDAAMTPTLLFFDAQGREATDRIVGISNIEYYAFYFDKAIASAIQTIADNLK